MSAPPFAAPKRPSPAKPSTGKAWEFQIERWNADYDARGLARVDRHHPEAKRVEGQLVYVSKGAPDFGGTVGGGRSVVFDAKETAAESFPTSKIPDHQLAALRRHDAMGAYAFLLVRFTTLEVDVLFWYREIERRKTLRQALKPDHGFRLGSGGWIEVVS